MRTVTYIDENSVSHNYSFFIDFYPNARLKVILTENAKKVTEITILARTSFTKPYNTKCAYVDVKSKPWLKDVLALANVKPTGEVYELNHNTTQNKRKKNQEYVNLLHFEEFDFTPLVNEFERQYRLDKVKFGMAQVNEEVIVNTDMIFYCYKVTNPTQHEEQYPYYVVCKDGIRHYSTKEYVEQMKEKYNIPQFRQFRHTPTAILVEDNE